MNFLYKCRLNNYAKSFCNLERAVSIGMMIRWDARMDQLKVVGVVCVNLK